MVRELLGCNYGCNSAFIGLAVDGTPPVRNVTALDLPIRYFRAVRVISESVRSYGSVEERSVHTGKVAGSIPARTTRQTARQLAVFVCAGVFEVPITPAFQDGRVIRSGRRLSV